MRPDELGSRVASNGFSTSSNGSTPKKPTTVSVNGKSSHSVNGSSPSHTNGSVKRLSPVRSPTYHGHNREEVTRILIQGLMDMGYNGAAATLSHESGYELESPAVAAFRIAVLDGSWSEAESILLGTPSPGEDADAPDHPYGGGLVLAEGADKAQMLFWLRQQKFLELLEQRELGMALMVLRQELTPLHHDMQQLHTLSSLLMCPAEDLRRNANWHGTIEESRRELLQDLTQSIAPSVMIRDHRLAELLDQVKRSQINNCVYHNTSSAPSLYSDHLCDRDNFPLRTWLELDDHSNEVYHVAFSYDGTKLATASSDNSVIIYETTTFRILQRLNKHAAEVTFVAWSPDGTKLISCAKDRKARVWDTSTGRIILTVEHPPNEASLISAAAWTPDSATFVTASFDRKVQLCHWDLQSTEPRHTWPGGFRAQDCAITPDGRRLVVIDSEKSLHVFNMNTYEEDYRLPFAYKLTSVAVSQDSKTVLVNVANGEVDMLDIDTGETIRKFEGQKQGQNIIRSAFGGAAENFVLSGSEDSKIYIWHKENGNLIETLRGHKSGCVTSVAWNPRDAGMFASAGDDMKVRIWTNTVSPDDSIPPASDRDATRHGAGRTAFRSTYRPGSNL